MRIESATPAWHLKTAVRLPCCVVNIHGKKEVILGVSLSRATHHFLCHLSLPGYHTMSQKQHF